MRFSTKSKARAQQAAVTKEDFEGVGKSFSCKLLGYEPIEVGDDTSYEKECQLLFGKFQKSVRKHKLRVDFILSLGAVTLLNYKASRPLTNDFPLIASRVCYHVAPTARTFGFVITRGCNRHVFFAVKTVGQFAAQVDAAMIALKAAISSNSNGTNPLEDERPVDVPLAAQEEIKNELLHQNNNPSLKSVNSRDSGDSSGFESGTSAPHERKRRSSRAWGAVTRFLYSKRSTSCNDLSKKKRPHSSYHPPSTTKSSINLSAGDSDKPAIFEAAFLIDTGSLSSSDSNEVLSTSKDVFTKEFSHSFSSNVPKHDSAFGSLDGPTWNAQFPITPNSKEKNDVDDLFSFSQLTSEAKTATKPIPTPGSRQPVISISSVDDVSFLSDSSNKAKLSNQELDFFSDESKQHSKSSINLTTSTPTVNRRSAPPRIPSRPANRSSLLMSASLSNLASIAEVSKPAPLALAPAPNPFDDPFFT